MNNSACTVFGNLYLQSRPYIYNGGLVGQLLSNLVIAEASSSLNIVVNSSLALKTYITNFFLSSSSLKPSFDNSTISYTNVPINNLATSVVGLIFLFFLFFTFVGGIIWILSRTYPQLFKKFQKVRSESVQPIEFLLSHEIEKRNIFFINQVFILCIGSIVAFTLFLFFFTFSIMAQINLQMQMLSLNTTTSFPSTWLQSSNLLNQFFYQMTNQSHDIFNSTIVNIGVSLNTVLSTSMNNLMTKLLQTFGVYDVFNNANKLIADLQSLTTSMQYIQDNANSTLSDINFQKGYLQATVQMLQYSLRKVCQAVSSNSDCWKYLNESDNFQIVINTNLVNFDSSTAMLFILNQFKLNITSLAIDFKTMQTNFNNQMIEQTNKEVEHLNLGNSVKELSTVWPFILNTISPWKTYFSTIDLSISGYLSTYGVGIFMTTSLLMLLVAGLNVVYILVVVRYSLLYILRRQIAYNLSSTSSFNPSFMARYSRSKRQIQKIKQDYSVPTVAIYTYIMIFSVMVVFIFTVSLVIVSTSHLFYNEVCVQIWRQEGLAVTDIFLDVFLNNNWNSLMQFMKTVNLPISFIFPQPSMVLSGIINNCTQDNGLFYALKMMNFINISSFIWSPQIHNSLETGLNITYRTFVNTNTKDLIPKNVADLLSIGTKITTFFDKVDYQPSIDQLSHGVIKMQNYSGWITSAIAFFSTINSRDANSTLRSLRLLESKIPSLQILETFVFNLSVHFQIIQNKRDNTQNINTLLYNISNMQSTLVDTPATYGLVKTIYTNIMLTELPINVETSMNSIVGYMINHVFPCSNLSSSVTLLLDNLCVSDGTIAKTCSYGFNMAVTCAFMMLMLHLLWNVIRKDLIEMESENVSTC